MECGAARPCGHCVSCGVAIQCASPLQRHGLQPGLEAGVGVEASGELEARSHALQQLAAVRGCEAVPVSHLQRVGERGRGDREGRRVD